MNREEINETEDGEYILEVQNTFTIFLCINPNTEYVHKFIKGKINK